jgi:hypothetical protein
LTAGHILRSLAPPYSLHTVLLKVESYNNRRPPAGSSTSAARSWRHSRLAAPQLPRRLPAGGGPAAVTRTLSRVAATATAAAAMSKRGRSFAARRGSRSLGGRTPGA